MSLKRVPSFSGRPDFPKGLQVGLSFGCRRWSDVHAPTGLPPSLLQVLVVDDDGCSSKEIASQLKELGYVGAWLV